MIISFISHNKLLGRKALTFQKYTIVPDHVLTHTMVCSYHMPAQPAWFHRLDEIMEQLRGMTTSHLDRQAVQKLIGVRERRARQLMAGLDGIQVGNAFAVSRLALLARLEETGAGDRFQWEVNRRARVVEELDRSRRQLAARRVVIPAAPDVREREVCALAAGIELKPGELCIRFDGAADLAAKLFELSQAMANDWGAIEEKAGKASA